MGNTVVLLKLGDSDLGGAALEFELLARPSIEAVTRHSGIIAAYYRALDNALGMQDMESFPPARSANPLLFRA